MMIFTVSTMSHVCLLVAVSMLSAVNGHQNNVMFQEETDIESSRDDNTDIQRRQAADQCGLRKAATPKRDGESEKSQLLDKILGGSFVKRGEIPWQVNINVDKSHRCGGVIVNTYWILTSASCINPKRTKKSSLGLVVGDHDLSVDEKGQQRFGADKIIIHKEFTSNNADNDIGLVKVATANGRGILFNDFVQPICLALRTHEFPSIGDSLTISGWELQSASATQPSRVLKKNVITAIDDEECNKLLQNVTLGEHTICGKGPSGKSNVCRGDFGGPVTFKYKGLFFLSGIISGVDGCNASSSAVLVTAAISHRMWILQTIAANSNGLESALPSVE